MKRIFLITTCLLATVILYAQSLEEIVNKHTAANKMDKISGFKTIKITEKISMGGIDVPTEICMKYPNKIKIVMSADGKDMIQVFDGEKGYEINPFDRSNEPVEMTPDNVSLLQRKNIFQNIIDSLLRKGQLSLAGEENVNGKPAFIITASVNEGRVNLFIDKSSYLLIKTSMPFVFGRFGVVIADSYMSDYIETNGIMLPMKTTLFNNGEEQWVETVTKVEVDIPMKDSLFKVK